MKRNLVYRLTKVLKKPLTHSGNYLQRDDKNNLLFMLIQKYFLGS